MHSEICPVCNGTGKYRKPADPSDTNAMNPEEICNGCSGLGWIQVADEMDEPGKGI